MTNEIPRLAIVVPVLPSRWHGLIHLCEEPDCVFRSFIPTTMCYLERELQESIVTVSVRDNQEGRERERKMMTGHNRYQMGRKCE